MGYPNICYISETVNSYTEPKFANVDLDLPSGTKWLKHNIGADSETECGKYFQWGATVGYYSDAAKSHSTWTTCPGNGGSFSFNDSAFSSWKSNHLTNGILNNDVDGAYMNTKGICKMPTLDQTIELISNTNTEWTTIDGVIGRKFISKKDSSKYIFIPAVGYFSYSSQHDMNYKGYTWTSSLYSVYNGCHLFATETSGRSAYNSRYFAMPIRAVIA